MKVRTSMIAILAVAAVVAGIGAGMAHTGGEEPWQKALRVRSEALNERYDLGDRSRSASASEGERALRLRSEGLNRRYGLGATPRTSAAGEPAWERALRLRSEGLNERYGLGEHSHTP